jgi:hypothetical protein
MGAASAWDSGFVVTTAALLVVVGAAVRWMIGE